MSESYALTTPIVPVVPTTTAYFISRVLIERRPWARFSVVLETDGGDHLEVRYTDEFGGTVAVTLINALNTANLSVKSLNRRILERLAADGKLPAGSVAGVPD